MKDNVFNLKLLTPLLADAQKRAMSQKEFHKIFKASCLVAGYNFKAVKEYLASAHPPEYPNS